MKKILVLIIVIGVSYFYFWYKSFKSDIIVKKWQILEIKKWETYRDLSEKFKLNKNYFKFYLKFNPPTNSLQAWSYKLKDNLDIWWIINSLKKPITTDKIITILEWWNIYDIDDYLWKNWLIKPWELLKLNNEKLWDFKNDFSFLKKSISFEWFLYPDTYYVNPNNFSLNNFINKMLTNFDNRVIKDLDISVDSINLLDTVNLASIVEKEEKSVKEKLVVAWILKKRLVEDWYIWADATVCYPYKLIFSECNPKFIVNHIDDKNDYNTRTKMWLPKTPICNPSADSIEAVINSKKTPYYFYLHDSDWKIHYASTNEEHIANKQLYIK